MYALKIVDKFDIRIVVKLQNIESSIVKRFYNNTSNILLKLFFKYEGQKISKLELEVYEKIKNIIFISEEDRRISGIDAVYEANPFVVTAGVDNSYFALKETINNDLIYLGSMDWKPNENAVLWFVEKVFDKVKGEYPGIKFYIVGKNPSERIKKLNCDNIIVTGIVDDVRPYLERTGICIVPLFIGGGMRVKILEVMSSGRPVITTSIGAEGIDYREGQDILIADDESGFIEKIHYLIENNGEKEKIINNGKRLIENEYTWEKVIFKYKKYIAEVIV